MKKIYLFLKKIKIQQDVTPENQKITKILSELISLKTKSILNSLFSILKSKIKKLNHEIFTKLYLYSTNKSQYNLFTTDYKTSKLNLKKNINTIKNPIRMHLYI